MPLLQINYGNRLISLRKSMHWSREKLACTINVSYDTIYRLEVGRRELTVKHAEAIARAYQLPLVEFWAWMCDQE